MKSSNLITLVQSVRRAQLDLGSAKGALRTAALQELGRGLLRAREDLLAANSRDLEIAEAEGLSGPLLHRLGLTPGKLDALGLGIEQLAESPDPVGQELKKTLLDDGLILRQVQSPIGVLLIVFESRPDVVIQIGALALRTGNAVILKGGKEAAHSNRALVACLKESLVAVGLDADAVALVETREEVGSLLALDETIDLVIPRGSGELVRAIQENTRIPVLGHAEGVCHLYLDAAADPAKAVVLTVDGKCNYPSACNATETLLVHREFLPHLRKVGKALSRAGVRVFADDASGASFETAEPADEEHWGREWGDLTLAVRTVESLEEAMDHIYRYGSGHTDAIVTENEVAAESFQRKVDSASVFVNASTRFADGYRYGLGAEVGISTGRIHARGPVGAEGLLTTRWLLNGEGHCVADYGSNGREFKHLEMTGVPSDPGDGCSEKG